MEFPPLLKRFGVDTWVLQGLHDRTAELSELTSAAIPTAWRRWRASRSGVTPSA
jgi:hypothetical protein